MPGRNLKFPDPKDYAAKKPAVLCPAERVIGLYNQENQASRQRITKTIEDWFSEQATAKGWKACRFVPEVQSRHGAGCILLNPLSVTINLNQIIITIDTEEPSSKPSKQLPKN